MMTLLHCNLNLLDSVFFIACSSFFNRYLYISDFTASKFTLVEPIIFNYMSQQDTRERRFPNRPQQVVALRPVVDDLSRDHPFQRLLGGDKNLRPFEAVSETKRRYLSLLF